MTAAFQAQYNRVRALVAAAGLDGADTSIQARPETDTVRVVRSWRVGQQETAMFRGYTRPWLADVDDYALGQRLVADCEAMDLALAERSLASVFALARRHGWTLGAILKDIPA